MYAAPMGRVFSDNVCVEEFIMKTSGRTHERSNRNELIGNGVYFGVFRNLLYQFFILTRLDVNFHFMHCEVTQCFSTFLFLIVNFFQINYIYSIRTYLNCVQN